MTKRPAQVLAERPASSPAAESWSDYLRSPALVGVLLALATALAYAAAGSNGFVDYDDGDYVTANPHVEGGLTAQSAAWALTTGHASNWHPLTWLSHMLDYQLFGRNPGEQHWVNVALHLANTVLLFLLLRRMTGAHWRSTLVAALFGLHPLHVESVAWVSERKDVLSTFFLFLTLMAYARFVEYRKKSGELEQPARAREQAIPARAASRGKNETARATSSASLSASPWPAYLLALVFFAFGLMSKPMLVTTPFLLLLLDYWPLNRLDVEAPQSKLKTAVALLIEKMPFFALTVVSSIVTLIVQQKGGAVSTSLTVGQRVGNALVSYARYLGKTIWPENLAVLYPHPGTWPAWAVIASVILLLAIFALVIWLMRTRRYIAVGWLWFFGGLVPVIGLVQVGIQSMADRYSYVPLIGIFVAAIWGLGDLASRFQWRREALAVVALLSLSACVLLTMRQVQFWHDTETLFQRAVEVEPKNYLAYNNLGFYDANHGKSAEALENYRKSLEINTNYEDALNNMGYMLAGQKRNAEAVQYYERALRVSPNHVEVNNNLGNALSDLGRIDEAIAHYQVALKYKPDHADAHNNLGIALAMKGRLEEAIPHFRDAIRFKPKYASAHSNLGNAFAVQQKWDEAIKEYQQCLSLNPDDAQAHNNLANVLAQQGKLEEAIRNYNEALRLNPNNPEAHFNLGMALLRQGKRDEARTHFMEALRMKPDYLEAQRQLAALGDAKPSN